MKQSTLFFILITLVRVKTAALQSDCARDLSNMYQELHNNSNSSRLYENLTSQSQNFLTLSGRTINDYGEYQTCLAQNNSHYFSMYFNALIGKARAQVLYGLCLPLKCSLQDIQENASGIIALYPYQIIFPVNTISINSTINFYDPLSKEPIVISKVISYGFFTLLISLTLIGTLLDCRQISKNKKYLPNENDILLDGKTKSIESVQKFDLKSIGNILVCFSVEKNMKKLLEVKIADSYDSNLEIFNGMRVLLFLWIVYGHTNIFGYLYNENLLDVKSYLSNWKCLIIFNAHFGVDAFFWLSGFLFAFIGIPKLQKMKQNTKNYISLIFHRWMRIWPPYALALLFFWQILPDLGSGPIWFTVLQTTKRCDNNSILGNLALIENFTFEDGQYCMGWAWYLSCEFQMFLITPFIIWFYLKDNKRGKFLIALILSASVTYSIIFGYHIGVNPNPPFEGIALSRIFREYYVRPWVRLPTYYIGLYIGIIYTEYKQQLGFSYKFGNFWRNNCIKRISHILGFIIMLIPIFIMKDSDTWTPEFNAVWCANQRILYIIGVNILIFPSLFGGNTLLKQFLSHKLFIPFSRIGFCAYLVHCFWIFRNHGNATTSFHFSYVNVVYRTLANVVQSYAAALILTLIIEVPVANIEQVLLSKKKIKNFDVDTKISSYSPVKLVEKNEHA